MIVKQSDKPAIDADFDQTPTTITFAVPAWVVDRREMTPEEFTKWVRLSAAMFRFDRGEISLGTAAALAGMNQFQMMGELKQSGIPTAQYQPGDVERELVMLEGMRMPGDRDA